MSICAARRVRHPRKRIAEQGFTMLEVLVSLLLVSVALLGQASMLTTAVKLNKGAGLRIEATILAAELAERMENNRAAANAGGYVVSPASSTASTAPKNCATSPCSSDELASYDLSVWQAAVVSNLPGATWHVTRAGSPVNYTIVLTWQERRDNARRVTYEDVGGQETASLTASKLIAP